MNEFMSASPQKYLTEITGLSLLYWVRSKKCTTFKKKNDVFYISKLFFMYLI